MPTRCVRIGWFRLNISQGAAAHLIDGREETLAGDCLCSAEADCSTEGVISSACNMDKTYTKCLTSRILMVPMAQQIHAAFAAWPAKKI